MAAPPKPRARRFVARGLTTAALGAVIACGPRASAPPPSASLWDVAPPFEVLTESRTLAPPPSLAGNRFLSGWRGWRDGPRVVYAPTGAEARVEFVHLGDGPRELAIDLDGLQPGDATRRVPVAAAGRSLGSVPLADPLRVPLPPDLPLGRVTVALGLDRPVTVLAGGLSSALPAGAARRDGDDLVESGDALVEWYLPPGSTTNAARLAGELVPPAQPASHQRFELSVDASDGARAGGFTWTADAPGDRRFSLPLPESGPLRVRLLARGAGEARWRNLRVEHAAPAGGPSPAIVATAATAARTEAAPAPPINSGAAPRLIVVVVFDALRADAVGYLGAGPDRTPTLDRLANAGVAFAAHRSVAPNTLPSTKSLFTGRVWRAGGGLSLPADLPTLAELLRARGYRTACVSGNQNVSPTFGMTRGFDFDAPDVKFPPPQASASRFNDNAARVRAAAVQWLHGLGPHERGFLYVHVIHPHNPYDPPADLRERFVPRASAGGGSHIDGGTETLRDLDRGARAFTPADVARLRGLYAASLRYADDELGALLGEIERTTAPGEALVAVTADHGEELADHGGFLHGYTVFEEMLRIPLVLWWPGHLGPARVETPTDTLDLFTTLLAAAGQTPPAGAGGRSLLGAAPAQPWSAPRFAAASAVRGGIFGARSERFKVVLAPRSGLHWGTGSGVGRIRDPEMVFDLATDPRETANLAGSGDPRVGWLRAELLRWMATAGPESRESAARPTIDAEARRRLKALGYVGN